MSFWQSLGLYKRLMQMQGEMETARADFETGLDDVVEFTRPDLPLEVDDKGKVLGGSLYEGTPAYCPRIMAKGFMGSMAGANIPWLKYSPSDRRLKGDDNLRQCLQDRQEHMLAVFRRATFYKDMPNFALNAVTLGTPIGWAEEDESTGRIYQVMPHYKENYFLRDYWGDVYPYHRKRKMNIRHILERFEGVQAKLSSKIREDIKEGRFDNEYEFLMCCYKYEDPIFDNLPEKINRPDRPWLAVYLELGNEDANPQPVLIEGYWSRAYFWWDWERNSNEIWARTPAWHAIHDIKGGQAYFKGLWQTAQLEADPAWYIPETLKGRFYLRPRAHIYATAAEMQTKPEPLTRGATNYPVAVEFGEMVNKTIERWFHKELFTLLLTRQQEGQAPLTVYETMAIMGEQSVLMAPNIESCEYFLGNVVKRYEEIERQAGRLPMPESYGIDLPDDFDAEFIGPLAQSQKNRVGMQTIMNGLGILQFAMTMFPELKYKVRSGKMLERALEEIDFTQGDIVPEDEFNKIIAGVAQNEQMMQLLGSSGQGANLLKALSGPVDKSSLLNQMGGAT